MEPKPQGSQPSPAPESPIPTAPRGVAVSGIVFAVLFSVSMVLIRLAAPADPNEPGAWLADPARRSSVSLALQLSPFAGIAFLWFMGSLRNYFGLSEDRFFATVFFGSGCLFVAMLFAAVAVTQSILDSPSAAPPSGSETYQQARRTAHLLMNSFGLKMAAVFMFVTSTIGLRTGRFARWLALLGYVCGAALLVVLAEFAWIVLLFPAWVLVVSSYVLSAEWRACTAAQPGLKQR